MKQVKSKFLLNKSKEPIIDIKKVVVDTRVFLEAIKKAGEGEKVEEKSKDKKTDKK